MVVSQLEISAPTQNPPQGYLFVCPPRDLRTGELLVFWTFDPSGAKRLSTEEAEQFGFPSIESSTQIHGEVWDSSVYAGLRKFHEGKGFDPGSQWHLTGPLYRLSSETDIPFGHRKPKYSPPPMFRSEMTINGLESPGMEVLFANGEVEYVWGS